VIKTPGPTLRPGDQHRRRPHIEVLIPITTLLGMDDDPCELTGYGPIPATMARHIATNGTWRRLLTDPVNGTVLEASTTHHDPAHSSPKPCWPATPPAPGPAATAPPANATATTPHRSGTPAGHT
jgi:hypothetical protein